MFVSFHPFNPLVGNYILGCSDYYVGKQLESQLRSETQSMKQSEREGRQIYAQKHAWAILKRQDRNRCE